MPATHRTGHFLASHLLHAYRTHKAMAKLCRFVKLQDRFNAQVFSFAVPSRILREVTPEVCSKDFVYGHQRWNVSITRSERHIGAFLKLQTPSQGLRCRLDFSFTVINKEHFTKNISFIEKSCEFTSESQKYGRKTFAETEDLLARNFVQDTGEFLLELEMRNIHNIFECFLRVPKDSHGGGSTNHRHGYGDRMESTYFLFGLSDWSVSLFPDSSSTEADGSVAVQLQRHSSFDHPCSVRYRVILGDEGTFDSGDMEQTLDASGIGEPFTVGASVSRLARGRSTLRVKVEMAAVTYVSEVAVNVLSRSKNRAHLYDRDKQAWMVEAEAGGPCLAFRLYYTDISHVPRRFTRFVSWHVRVLTRGSGAAARGTMRLPQGPYSKYYVQQEVDDGLLMNTDIPMEEVSDPDSIYVDPDDRKVTLYVEWLESHLLVAPNYNSHDDVTRLHKHQMTREIMALQAENYALEKQLYSYQQSIAKKDSRGRSDSFEFVQNK